ncbi:MAG: hypothetical protein AB4038_03155 [Prochloraceae cyanobacterium]
MGRKAKLKKMRREASAKTSPSAAAKTTYEPTNFVKQLERQGYQLDRIKPSPELPDRRVDPQV